MKKHVLITLCVTTLFLCGLADGVLAGSKMELSYGGTSSSSGAYAWCVSHAKAINDQTTKAHVTVMETGASIENMRLLKRKDIDYGMASIDVAVRVYTGVDEFKGAANPNARLLWLWVTNPHTVFVTAESGVNSIYELSGKPFGSGLTGSATEALTTRLFKANNIKPKWFRGATAASRDATKNKQIIGYSKSGGPDSSVLDVAVTTPIKVLPIPDGALKKAQAAYPGMFVRSYIKANAYKGQTEAVPTFPVVMYDVASTDLPQDVAYEMCKAVYGSVDDLVAAYRGAAFPDSLTAGPQAAVKSAAIFLHAGMVQYCKEAGIDVPSRLIPPEYKD